MHAEEFDEVGGRHAFRKDWIIKKGFNPTLLRVLDVEGDSMSPYINDGDVVLVNTDDKRIINQEVYAIRVQDELMVKRLFKQMDGRVRVISDNPDKNSYPDDWLTPDSGAEILGKVVHRAG